MAVCRLGVKDERAAGLLLVPMYAALANEQQAQAFQPAPAGVRKVCLRSCLAQVLADHSVTVWPPSSRCRPCRQPLLEPARMALTLQQESESLLSSACLFTMGKVLRAGWAQLRAHLCSVWWLGLH